LHKNEPVYKWVSFYATKLIFFLERQSIAWIYFFHLCWSDENQKTYHNLRYSREAEYYSIFSIKGA